MVVERVKMFFHAFKAFSHALADCHAGHHDDELGEAVFLVQLVDRADVDVGLAGARLHLDVQLARPAVRGGISGRKAFLLLNGMEITLQLRRGKMYAVGVANLAEQRILAARFRSESRVHELLAAEQIAHTFDGFGLMLLVGREFKFQNHVTPSSARPRGRSSLPRV